MPPDFGGAHRLGLGCLLRPRRGRRSGSNDTSVKVWEVETGKTLGSLVGPLLTLGPALSVAFGPGGLLASGSTGGAVHIWDVGALSAAEWPLWL